MSVYTSPLPVTGSATTFVTSSIASANILSRNDLREKFILTLTGSTTAYVGFSPSVTTQSFVVYLNSGDVFSENSYKGPVYAIFSSQSSTTYLMATEIKRS